jgi:hypothetical protein
MGWFIAEKCGIHGIEMSIGKDYMCQEYYYCPRCRANKRKEKERQNEDNNRIAELEIRIRELETKSGIA